jgi:DNA-binding protein YbaB
MADNENDENLKKAKQAADMVRLQQKAQDYQNKLNDLMNKEYQGKFQGISVKMKGDSTLLDVRIEQSFYETAGKGQIEKAILTLFNNPHNAIQADQNALREELQMDIDSMQREQYGNN